MWGGLKMDGTGGATWASILRDLHGSPVIGMGGKCIWDGKGFNANRGGAPWASQAMKVFFLRPLR